MAALMPTDPPIHDESVSPANLPLQAVDLAYLASPQSVSPADLPLKAVDLLQA